MHKCLCSSEMPKLFIPSLLWHFSADCCRETMMKTRMILKKSLLIVDSRQPPHLSQTPPTPLSSLRCTPLYKTPLMVVRSLYHTSRCTFDVQCTKHCITHLTQCNLQSTPPPGLVKDHTFSRFFLSEPFPYTNTLPLNFLYKIYCLVPLNHFI